MIPKIRCVIVLVFFVFVKHITPLKVYVLEDVLQRKPSKQPVSIYLKPIVKGEPDIKKTLCQKLSIICLAHLQNTKNVLRGRDDTRVEDRRSSSYSDEHSDSGSNDSDNEHYHTIFDDLTRNSREKTKTSAEHTRIHTLHTKPGKDENTGIDINKLMQDQGFYAVSGRRLAKIVRKKPKISKILTTGSKEAVADDSDDDDEEEEEEEEEKVPASAKTQDESESEEDEINANDNASPETEEQEKTKKGQKSVKKLTETVKKRKPDKKFKTPKRFEVVDNGESEEPKKVKETNKVKEDSDEKADETTDDKTDESGNPAPEDIDLTDIVEKSSIETTTEKLVLVDLADDKEKYTYIQGLHRKVQVGNKQETEEDDEPPEKTAEEDIGLLYRREGSRLPYFLPKRYIWDEDDYKNLGYFWFNGPQGRQSPGNYRIRYKK